LSYTGQAPPLTSEEIEFPYRFTPLFVFGQIVRLELVDPVNWFKVTSLNETETYLPCSI